MKKLIFLLSIVLSGCSTCMLAQIPPQKIYTGSSCSAPIPNYLLKITASDNCEITSITQTPVAGTMLTASNKVATVVIKATDASGNSKQISFTVTLIDTIKPVFTIDPSLTVVQLPKQIGDIYNLADLMLEYNLTGTQRDAYNNYMMITWTAPGHAKTGVGHRYQTFVPNIDTVLLIKK
jgi:uncharacterized protein YceK